MAANLPGASRGSSTYKFEGDEIASLVVSPQLVRWEDLDPEHVLDLATKIAHEGQIQPVIVRKAANGRPELVAGRHRRAAILHLNEHLADYGKSMPFPLKAVFHELSDEDALLASFQENAGKPPTVMDLAKAVVNFTRLEWDNAKIAAKMSTPWNRVTPARVSQLKSYIRLPHLVQSLLHRGTIPESCARAMLVMGIDAPAMEEMAGQIERGEMRPGEVVALAGKKQREKGKRARRAMPDLREMLEGMKTDKANKLLDWLDGALKDEQVSYIFAADPATCDYCGGDPLLCEHPEAGEES